MSIKQQMTSFYAVVEHVATQKPNTHVIQKLGELRRIAHHVKAAQTPTLHPTLTAKMVYAQKSNSSR
jgi:diaminopimelate decarboxylase